METVIRMLIAEVFFGAILFVILYAAIRLGVYHALIAARRNEAEQRRKEAEQERVFRQHLGRVPTSGPEGPPGIQ
jgi:hypothetical protein